ncbi:MAG: GntR family transcriptional regulator [Alphaproteobacteria bacterium]|nr:GntR family transcriptional regulator [Alphaproteobacteria bacterium]
MLLDHLAIESNGVPIYVQLRAQIAAALGRGALAPGARLPTMREVAVALKIDLNTVQRAYAELERDGLITLTRGRGSFVTHTPPREARAGVRETADRLAAQAAAQARAAGIGLDELTAALARLKAAR